MAREIIESWEPGWHPEHSGTFHTYEKVDGEWTDNEGHGSTREEARENFVDTTNIKQRTEKD